MTTTDRKTEEQSTLESPVTSYPKNRINILLMESISQKAVNFFVENGFAVETAHLLPPETLAKKLENTHVIGVRSKTKLRRDLLMKHGHKLLCIGCFCIGTDQTDLECAAELGIPVFNSPFANTRSVAELVLSNAIALARKVGDQNKWMHSGIWNKTAAQCYEVRGKTMGIIGYGHVGSQLSILAEALGFRVVFYDIIPKLPLGNARSISTMSELLKMSDFVTIHVPYTKQTHNLIDEYELSIMKQGSYLMNAARGKCVNIEAAAAALKSGKLGGAYFDVYPVEPIDKTCCLIDCPNTILTPHIGGSTQEAQANIGLDVAMKIVRFINEGCTVSCKNFPAVGLQSSNTCHRILNVHKNVPGVLKKINEILCEHNVSSQLLKTYKNIGYLLVDVDADKKLSMNVKKAMDELPETIRTRVVFSPGCL